MVNMMAIAITPAIVLMFLPFFRKIDATSAYEYLEKRFNRVARLFASASFVLFQIGRMAIVMYLPALALAAITPMTEQQCILLMGVLSIVYCTMGGLEAVVWTDTIQSFVLLGGALFSFVLIVTQVDGGLGGFMATASEHNKLHMVNWDFASTSFATTALWVVVLGGLGQNLVPYTSDMAVVQRYMSVPDMARAKRAIWTNAVAILPASLLFFGVGTALFVFYAHNPDKLDPAFKTDAIFPLFIARELPMGIAGLVVAGIFAAAQSTISTSMNSTSTPRVDRRHGNSGDAVGFVFRRLRYQIAVGPVHDDPRPFRRFDVRAVLPGDLHDQNQWTRSHCRSSRRGRCTLSCPAIHRRSPVALRACRHHHLFHQWLYRELGSPSISEIHRRIDHSYA
jgi:SSS family transporter